MAKILLIEPEETIARAYCRALETDGHSIRHALSAQVAVGSLDEHMPDLVILDLQLADHDGVEFLHEFSSYSEWRHIPVIINSFLRPDRKEPHFRLLKRDFNIVSILYKPELRLEALRREVNRAFRPNNFDTTNVFKQSGDSEPQQ